MACSATARSSSRRCSLGSSGLSRPSWSSAILASEKYRDSDHTSSCSHVTAPTRRVSEASDGKTCTTLDPRLVSLLVRSWRLLVRRRFQWEGGKSR